jgi:hypothetical protein
MTMSSSLLDQTISLAEKDLYAFARFVAKTEALLDASGIDPELIARYNQAWFDLEIVNASALDAWESEGRPAEWIEQWQKTYQDEARSVLADYSSTVASLINTGDFPISEFYRRLSA